MRSPLYFWKYFPLFDFPYSKFFLGSPFLWSSNWNKNDLKHTSTLKVLFTHAFSRDHYVVMISSHCYISFIWSIWECHTNWSYSVIDDERLLSKLLWQNFRKLIYWRGLRYQYLGGAESMCSFDIISWIFSKIVYN